MCNIISLNSSVPVQSLELSFQERYPNTRFAGRVVVDENGRYLFIPAANRPCKETGELDSQSGRKPLKQRVVEFSSQS